MATSNTLLTISMITNEALAVLENNLTFTKFVNRDYDSYFGNQDAQIGDTLNIRKPPRYVTRSGPALQVQGSTETYTPVTLTQKGADIDFSSKDLSLSIAMFSERFVKPLIASVANTIDYEGLTLYNQVYQSVGTPGTTPNTMDVYLEGKTKLDNAAAPNDGERSGILSSVAESKLVSNLKGLFNDTSEIARQYKEGTMGRMGGFKFSMDQNVNTHTSGIQDPASVPSVNTAPVSGATSISFGGMTNGDTLAVGDVFSIAGVYDINPQNRQSTGQLKQFVVTTAVTFTGATGTVSFSPAIVYVPGAQQDQTVNSLPVANAAISLFGQSGGQSPQNMVFHKDAFTVASANLIIPKGVDMAYRARSDKLRFSMRAVRDYDVTNDRFPLRIDVLYGWAAQRPELAARVWG